MELHQSGDVLFHCRLRGCHVQRYQFVIDEHVGRASQVIGESLRRIRSVDMQLKLLLENFLHFAGYTCSLLTTHSSRIAAVEKHHGDHIDLRFGRYDSEFSGPGIPK